MVNNSLAAIASAEDGLAPVATVLASRATSTTATAERFVGVGVSQRFHGRVCVEDQVSAGYHARDQPAPPGGTRRAGGRRRATRAACEPMARIAPPARQPGRRWPTPPSLSVVDGPRQGVELLDL